MVEKTENRFNAAQQLQVVITVMVTTPNDVENQRPGELHTKVTMAESYGHALLLAQTYTQEIWWAYRELYVSSVITTITLD